MAHLNNHKRVPIRNKEELALLKKSGQITASALQEVIKAALPGKSLLDLEEIAVEEIKRMGGEAAFKTVPDYHWATCLTINEEVVHGIPRDIKLKDGDVLGIDLGAIYQGWYTDASWSVIVGKELDPKLDQAKHKFLQAGEKALWEAIKQARAGQRVGDISWAIQRNIEKAGYNVVRSLSGHGVGKSYHEEPEILEYGKPGNGVKLASGMVLAIEAIYTQGSGEVHQKEDGWTVAAEGGLGGLFEMTVIVRSGGPEVITDWRKIP